MQRAALTLIIGAILAGITLLAVEAYRVNAHPDDFTGSWRGHNPRNLKLERSIRK
jgi:hypothetical protein